MTCCNAIFSIRTQLNSIFKTPLFVRKYRKIIRIKCFCLLKFSFHFYLYIYLIYVIILISASGRSWRLVMRTQLSPRAAVSYILTQAVHDYPPGIFTFAGQTEMHRQIHGAVHTKKPREWERFYTSLNQNFSLLESCAQERVPGVWKSHPRGWKTTFERSYRQFKLFDSMGSLVSQSELYCLAGS